LNYASRSLGQPVSKLAQNHSISLKIAKIPNSQPPKSGPFEPSNGVIFHLKWVRFWWCVLVAIPKPFTKISFDFGSKWWWDSPVLPKPFSKQPEVVTTGGCGDFGNTLESCYTYRV